jgi:hypothetical protein
MSKTLNSIAAKGFYHRGHRETQSSVPALFGDKFLIVGGGK